MHAAANGNLDCVEHLVAKGAKLDATSNVSAAPPARPPSPLGPSPSAFRHHLPACRRRFIRVCAAAAASRQAKWTALHHAAYDGHAPCVEALLKAGADARLKDEVRDGAEGRGGRRKGAWGRGAGATEDVSAAPPAAPSSPLRPSPSALAARRPCRPTPRRRRSPRVAPPPRLRRTATRPSCTRLPTASSTASSSSSPRVPSLTPQAT